MKGFIVFLSILLIVGLILVFTGFAVSGFSIDNFNWAEDADFSFSEFAGEDSFTQIVTNVNRNDIYIVRGDSFKVTYPVSEKHAESMNISVTIENNTLRIYDLSIKGFSWRDLSTWVNRNMFGRLKAETLRITITLPHEYNGELNIKTTNANLVMNDAGSFSLISLQTTNGNITLGGGQTGSLTLITTNGIITINNFACHNFSATSTNGIMNIKGLQSETLIKIRTTNGDITVADGSANKIDIGATNGDLKVNNNAANAIEIRTTNGRITVDKNTASTYQLNATNGEININGLGDLANHTFAISTRNGGILVNNLSQGNAFNSGTGDVRVNASTTNGRIRVNS